jgi:hypothetical protein
MVRKVIWQDELGVSPALSRFKGQMSASARPPVISELRERIARLEGVQARARMVLPFGVAAIDGVLPEGGLALGGLHEVAGAGNGAVDGAAAALFTAGIATRTAGKVLWCVTRPDLFAPAIEQADLPPGRVIYVEAGDEKSVLACFEEGLRGGFGAVIAEIARLSMTTSRRLQLAAEAPARSASPFAAGADRRRQPISASRPPPRPAGGYLSCRRRHCRFRASGGRDGTLS